MDITAILKLLFITHGDVTLGTTVIAALTLIAFFFLKFRGLGLRSKVISSRIDNQRLETLEKQATAHEQAKNLLKKENELLRLERDHYRSRTRDLIFQMQQLEWFHKRNRIKYPDDEELAWPLNQPMDRIEEWAMSSPLESNFVQGGLDTLHDNDEAKTIEFS